MKVIGLSGGIASGKSVVAKQLVSLGAGLLDADKAGHEVLKEAEVKHQLAQRFGPGILDPQGEIHRPALAKIVFEPTPAGKQALAELEQITHPRIGNKLQAQLHAWQAAGRYPVAVLDAPVMDKAGWNRFCDEIWFIDCPEVIRMKRAGTRGWSDEEFRQREAAQPALDLKKSQADRIIQNNNTLESLQAQTTQHWQRLVDSSAPPS